MWPAILIVAGTLVGTIIGVIGTYVVQRKLRFEGRPTKKVRCHSTYCLNLLAESASGFDKELEVRVDGQVLPNPVVINYRIQSIGNEVIRNCNIKVSAARSDQIARHQILPDSEVLRDRINTIENTGNRLKLEWSYINPRDVILLTLLVAPCEDAKCVTLEVDSEGLEVDMKPMQMDCRVELPGSFHGAEAP